MAEEYCWAITQALGRSCCVGIRISTGLPFYTHIYLTTPVLSFGLSKILFAPNHQERNVCLSWGRVCVAVESILVLFNDQRLGS